MPKIDLAAVPVIRRLVYPEPLYAETEAMKASVLARPPG